jgi:serine/threonine protein kinase
MDTTKTDADSKDIGNCSKQTLHPNISKALTVGKYAEGNRCIWEELQRLLSPGKAEEKYRPLHRIGYGTFSTVYKAEQLEDGHAVTIKMIKLYKEHKDAPYLYPFQYEIETMKKLCPRKSTSYKIPCYFDSYVVGDQLWLVMEYIQGVDLQEALDFKLTKQEITVIFYHILKALDYMHKHGVMHNDLKLDNVMLGKNGTVKVIDFGQSTPITHFMINSKIPVRSSAPEILKGKPYGSNADIWSVGIMLYKSLFREGPFAHEKDNSKFKELMLSHGQPPIPDKLDKSMLDPDMADLLDQCLTVDRRERPSARRLLHHKLFKDYNILRTNTVRRLVNKVLSHRSCR